MSNREIEREYGREEVQWQPEIDDLSSDDINLSVIRTDISKENLSQQNEPETSLENEADKKTNV